MFNLIGLKLKKVVGIIALACFLCSPLSYAVQSTTVSAASHNTYSKDHKNPPPPPKDDRHKNDKDDDDGYSKGNIVSAVLIGGVIGAVIAKNT